MSLFIFNAKNTLYLITLILIIAFDRNLNNHLPLGDILSVFIKYQLYLHVSKICYIFSYCIMDKV